MTSPPLERVTARLRQEAERLLAISPLFGRLTQGLDAAGWRELCRPTTEAILPGSGSEWLPAGGITEPTEAMRELRLCKQHGLRHVIWWELGLHGAIDRSYLALSQWADGLIETALTQARAIIAPRCGELLGGRFAVIGLGKLGGRELNLGSDVDLLFIWDGAGESTGGRRQLAADGYFAELGRTLIRLLDEHSPEGQVWPVDMRLRPGGTGAPIAMSIEATLNHYLNYGQTWERAMLIKARHCAGDADLSRSFLDEIEPFIYRRYLDYSAVAALAEMKARIDAQAGQRPLAGGFDVKRGRGGIREIEFTIQALQLLHGGRHPELRSPESHHALEALAAGGFIETKTATSLATAYAFWRRIEHAVQARQGEQTQRLPDDYADYLGRALAMDDIEQALLDHAEAVHTIFYNRVLPIELEDGGTVDWLTAPPWDRFPQLDAQRRTAFAASLDRISALLARDLLPERSHGQIRAILALAMPRWIDDHNGPQALDVFADLLVTIAGRANWIDLLATHKGALEWFIGVLSASRYLSRQIVDHPALLEWPLLAERGETEIDRICAQIDALPGDVDSGEALLQLNRLVELGRTQCALHIDAHRADSETIGAWLAEIADHAVQACLRLSLAELGLSADFPFVAVALGKHGSQEMSLSSDLDLIFILADDAGAAATTGDRRELAQRLGRRLVRQLSGRAPYSAGYRFDGRLRPSGSSGILVTTLDGFRDYQLHEAQTWEHQALCRARPVAGPARCREAVEEVIAEIIALPRDRIRLAVEIMAMREKMLTHLAGRDPGCIDLKQDPGGLVDIEFTAQFLRLAGHGQHRGTLTMLDEAASQLNDTDRSRIADMATAYRLFREVDNMLRVELGLSSSRIPRDPRHPAWTTLARHVSLPSPAPLLERMHLIHGHYEALLGAASRGDVT